ncbi:MAG: DUF4012 domain-containing protein, partial [Chloroflexota bacterium]|nr:DUF4012 domain-containing protein [Chloroflexota bacterium]
MRLVSTQRSGFIIAAILILGIVLLGATGLVLRGRVSRALAATRPLTALVAKGDIQGGCAAIAPTSDAWAQADVISRPLAPVLHRLGWIPGIGGDLQIAPELISLARQGTAAGVLGCTLVEPVLAEPAGPDRLSLAVQLLHQQPQQLDLVLQHLQHANAAWDRAAPYVDQSRLVAPYRTDLRRLGKQLSTAVQMVKTMRRLAPQLPVLLGVDATRHYLVVLQNPFELRATGGFMGVICVVRVDHARPTLRGCRPSEAYGTPAPDTSAMPFPYSRYLRLSDYYLRDANWSPDFPTAARTLQHFWALNGQTPVDGVIAADPYALIPILAAVGPIAVGDGTQMQAATVVDVLMRQYYDGATFRDKGGLAELVPLLLERLFTTEVSTLPAFIAGIRTAFVERHLAVAVNDAASAAFLAEMGWDGGIRATEGDTLRIVESDVGYGAVNAFVERLTAYDVTLDRSTAPLTATLTLTWTNQYSPWAEAPTAYAVHGQCTDPTTLRLERRSGCYASYVRIYVPQGSRLLDAAGFEEVFQPEDRYQRTVFAGYLRVMPGERRVVQLRYRLPSVKPGKLLVEKQPGTLAPPLLVRLHSAGERAER